MTIIRIGLDTAKHVFQVHGVDENEQTVVRRQIRRSEMGKFFKRLAPTRIELEACGASHYWGAAVARARARSSFVTAAIHQAVCQAR